MIVEQANLLPLITLKSVPGTNQYSEQLSGNISCLREEWEPLMKFEIAPDRHQQILLTSVPQHPS